MVVRFLAALFLCCLGSGAFAQTTFTSGDCNADITISNGGLTLTSSHVGTYVGCRASQGKQSGALYYEATLGHAPVATGWGVAGGGSGLPQTANVFTTAAGFNLSTPFVAFMGSTGAENWNNVTLGGGATITTGKTIGVAVNMDADPWEIWVTPDVTGTTGFGGGPLWNSSNTSSPTLAGTGYPTGVFPPGATAGTGARFFIPGGALWPIWEGQALDSSTFNFGASAFVGAVPTGYVAWNNASGNTAYPGPLNPLKINVSNAPGWQASHAYADGSRVNAGPGWSGSAYTSGAAICLFGKATGGTQTSGTDATAFNAACTSGTPSNTGGIPGGSWPGATTVTDGTVTWALLTKVDYATLTALFNDTAATWAPTTNYPGGAFVRSGGNLYMQLVAFSSPAICVSGSVGPTASPDGTCHWTNVGPLAYSPNANVWPHQLQYGANGAQYEAMYAYDVNVTVWYGGVAQQVYGPQQSGENLPILDWFHTDYFADAAYYCFHGSGLYGDRDTGGCKGTGGGAWIQSLTVAPGDSFTDNFTASTPLRVDQTKGVTVTNTMAWAGPSGYFTQSMGEPIAFSDNGASVNGFQLYSANGVVVSGHNFVGPGNQHANGLEFINDIIYSGGASAPAAITCDGGCSLINDVVVSSSTVSGAVGAVFAYQNRLISNTIFVGTGAANSTAIRNQAYFGPGASGNYYNNLLIGFANPWAHDGTGGGNWTGVIPAGSNNAITAAAGGYGGTFTDALGNAVYSAQLPGVNTSSGCTPPGYVAPCSGLTGANQLVNPTPGASFDARIKSTSADIYGAGVNFASVPAILENGGAYAPVSDAIKQAWSPRWDIGAEKFVPGAPFTFTGNSLASSTFYVGAAASTVIGSVIVGSTGTPAGATTLSLSGANAQGFRLDSSSLPANLICPSGNCPAAAGPFTDLNLVATNAAAVGSPAINALSLMGIAAPVVTTGAGRALR